MWSVEEFAINVVRPLTPVLERREEHDDEYAFVHANVSFSFHKTEIECRAECKRALAGFFFQVRKRFGGARGPVNRTVRPRAEDVDVEEFTVLLDHTFNDTSSVGIRVEPTACQFVSFEGPGCCIGECRIQMTTLFEVHDLFLITIVNYREVFTNKKVHPTAVVFEFMKLCEDDQSFHDHCLQSRFRESEIVHATEAGGRAR